MKKSLTQTMMKDDDDETTQCHSPSTPSERPGLGMRPRLAAILSETGLKLEAKAPNTARDVSRILGLTHGLIRFSVKPSKGIAFCPEPLFAVRVDLSKSGVPHPHRFLGDIKWYNSEDPCLRLGIQYRLLDNNDGRGASVNWEWASASASDVGRKELLERIYQANTFVELLENKTARELFGISRRSLVSWYQARRPRQARSSRIEKRHTRHPLRTTRIQDLAYDESAWCFRDVVVTQTRDIDRRQEQQHHTKHQE